MWILGNKEIERNESIHLAYAFSSKADQNSFFDLEWQKTNFPPLVGNKSSTTTSTHWPYLQNWKWKIPAYWVSSVEYSCALWSGITCAVEISMKQMSPITSKCWAQWRSRHRYIWLNCRSQNFWPHTESTMLCAVSVHWEQEGKNCEYEP